MLKADLIKKIATLEKKVKSLERKVKVEVANVSMHKSELEKAHGQIAKDKTTSKKEIFGLNTKITGLEKQATSDKAKNILIKGTLVSCFTDNIEAYHLKSWFAKAFLSEEDCKEVLLDGLTD